MHATPVRLRTHGDAGRKRWLWGEVGGGGGHGGGVEETETEFPQYRPCNKSFAEGSSRRAPE